jgi:hypothetical protein
MPYKDPQKQQEANAKWLAKNRDRVREYQRQWKQERRQDPEFQAREREAKKKYSQNPENREKINAANRSWKERNPEKFKAIIDRGKDTRARYRIRLRLEVLEAYGNKCACCGEEHPDFLTIDHINNDGAAHRRELFGDSRGVGSYEFYLWLKREGFPKDNFQCLCMNCNWAKGKYGVCPHQIDLQRLHEITEEALNPTTPSPGHPEGCVCHRCRLAAEQHQALKS